MNLISALQNVEDKYGEGWENLPDSHPDIVILQRAANNGITPIRRGNRKMTKEEEDHIRANHKHSTSTGMARELKMSNELMRRFLSEMGIKIKARGRAVIQLDMEGSVIRRFPSASEVEREMGIKAFKISYVCRGKKETVGGYKWKFEEEAE